MQNLSVKLFVVGFKRNPDYKEVGLCRFHCTGLGLPGTAESGDITRH